MDLRHQLYKSLDKLAVDPDTTMSGMTDSEPASSGVTIEGLRQKLVERLDATHVEIEDLSGKKHLYSYGRSGMAVPVILFFVVGCIIYADVFYRWMWADV